MRKIYMYKNDGAKGQVDSFIKTSNIKIRKKFDFILRYIADERNQFKEPYVKHFSIEKYKRLYELRLKAAGTMVRIIFYNIDDNIILLNAFIKRDKRDTEQALEHALKLIEHLDRVAETPVDYLTEVEIN
ncbi:MAG: type II toxin-antitoxin system RelE/ParE family toxin [Clostridia bacterium]|nr:type II toxin-antitoxin system RelE/ParE family toxin [Clostridia bacterium]